MLIEEFHRTPKLSRSEAFVAKVGTKLNALDKFLAVGPYSKSWYYLDAIGNVVEEPFRVN